MPVDGSTFWVRLTTVGGAGGYQDYQYTAPQLQQSQTITFPNPGPLTYGTSPVTLTATATSGLQVTYTVISGPATVNGSVLTITGAGNVVVEADQAGNSNWLAGSSGTGHYRRQQGFVNRYRQCRQHDLWQLATHVYRQL